VSPVDNSVQIFSLAYNQTPAYTANPESRD